MSPRWRCLAALLATTLPAASVLAACGSERDASAAPSTSAAPTTSTSTSTTLAPEVPAAPTEEAPGRVLVLGDSLAEGAAEVGGLEERLHDAGFEFVEVLAEAGEGVDWGIEQVQSRAIVPEVVVVALGTNPSGNADGFGVEVRTLLRDLRRRGAVHIAWLTPAHRDEDRYDEKIAILERIDDIDLLADWAARAEADPGVLLADGLHPSEEGYAELAEFLVATAIDVDH